MSANNLPHWLRSILALGMLGLLLAVIVSMVVEVLR